MVQSFTGRGGAGRPLRPFYERLPCLPNFFEILLRGARLRAEQSEDWRGGCSFAMLPPLPFLLQGATGLNMQPVKPVEVEVIGIHPRFSRLLVVQVKLDAPPNTRWRQLFLAAGLASEGSVEPMTLEGNVITLTMPDAELEAEVGRIEQRIRLVNARISLEHRLDSSSHPEPTMRMSQAVRLDAFSPEVRARMEEARMAATRLSGCFLSAQWEPVAVPAELLGGNVESAN